MHIDSTDSVSASTASEYGTCQYAYATGRAPDAIQVKGDNPKRNTLALQVGGWS
jgi:hypothetical protein